MNEEGWKIPSVWGSKRAGLTPGTFHVRNSLQAPGRCGEHDPPGAHELLLSLGPSIGGRQRQQDTVGHHVQQSDPIVGPASYWVDAGFSRCT
jgi:hypothetical protein